MTEAAKAVSSRVLGLRQRLHWTQQQLADHLGVTQATVNRWERGRKAPSPLAMHELARLEEALDAGAVPEAARGQAPALNLQVTIQIMPGATAKEIDLLIASIARHFPGARAGLSTV